MASFPQQYGDQSQRNSSPATGASWNAAALPAPQHSQSAPSSYRRPPPGQPRDHAGVLQGAIVPSENATGNHRPTEGRGDVPPPVGDIAAQAQLEPQGLQYVNMGYYDMANVAPPAPEMVAFNDEIQQAVAGPAPPFLDDAPHQGPVPQGRASEVLRQLALLYLNDPNSQLAMIRMEPGHNSEVTVVIALKLTDL